MYRHVSVSMVPRVSAGPDRDACIGDACAYSSGEPLFYGGANSRMSLETINIIDGSTYQKWMSRWSLQVVDILHTANPGRGPSGARGHSESHTQYTHIPVLPMLRVIPGLESRRVATSNTPGSHHYGRFQFSL